jgi:hypothetical protein
MIYKFDEVQEVKRLALKELQKQAVSCFAVGFIVGVVVASLAWLIWFLSLID